MFDRFVPVCLAILVLLTACQPADPPPTPVPDSAPESGQSADPIERPVLDIDIPQTDLIQPADFSYLGAFRLPYAGERPLTFEYGGAAMTYSPAGTLYITGHDRLAYGEMPDGNQIAEVSIPDPVISTDVYALPVAEFVQPFAEVTDGAFAGLDEIPRVGLLYLDTALTGPLIHIAWGMHFHEGDPFNTHAWISPDLSNPDLQGPWQINAPSYATTGYMAEIPQTWADLYANGYVIGTGRFRDGGWSGMGPSLYAYQPWDDSGQPASANSTLDTIPLLQYEESYDTESFDHALDGYQHPDEWEGAAWLTTADGRSAVIFAGTKGIGEKSWYGWANPAGADLPCIEADLIGQYTLCRTADGGACPESDMTECRGHNDFRGWWSSAFEGQIIFYDPSDLARVAAGQMAPWEPQPYAVLSIDEHLFRNPDGVEVEMIGAGAQRRFLVSEMAYDRTRGRIYVLEPFAEGAQPVVHVWEIQ